jgi:hypothetical protein
MWSVFHKAEKRTSLKMEAANFSVIFLSTYHPSGHRNPDDYNVGLKIQEAH